MNMSKPTLGVFYICFKERTAIEKSIESFKLHHPDGPIYLSSDGGYDYSYLEQKFDKLKCSLDPEQTVGVTAKIEEMMRKQEYPLVPLYMAAMEYLRRINLAIDYCKTDYILTMEPDVFIRGPLTCPQDPIHGIGPKENALPDYMQKYIVDHGGYNNVLFGPVAGIIKSEALVTAYNDLREKPWKMLEWLLMDPRLPCYDFLLCFTLSMYGYRYEPNPELVECLRNPNWKNTNHPLVHQYYENYGASPDEEGKHRPDGTRCDEPPLQK